MIWLTNIVDAVFPRPTGLEIDEPDPLAVQLPRPPGRFFHALPVLLSQVRQPARSPWCRRLSPNPRP